MPLFPVLSVVLAYGLTVWPKRLGAVRWGTVGLAFVLMCLNLFPIGGTPGTAVAQALSPRAKDHPYLGQEWPQRQVVEEIIRTTPQLRATVGVLPRMPQINHNNFNYYGALRNFQVYGREVGSRKRFVTQDARSLSWFLTKTNDPGSPEDARIRLVQTVEQSPDFQVQKTWNLLDGSILKLYHRAQPPVQVNQIQNSKFKIQNSIENSIPNSPSTDRQRVKLERVSVPSQARPGVPVPVTYEWIGSWEQLKSGIVLLSWNRDRSQESEVRSQSTISSSQIQLSAKNPQSIPPEQPLPKKVSQTTKSTNVAQPNQERWLHDHGIGLGELYSGRLSDEQLQGSFQVIETTAMLPMADTAPGTYTLKATYLNRETGENYPIAVPPVTLNITPNAPVTPAPELDLVTQMRTLAASLPEGREALDRVFDEIGRINQYDPVQDYTLQAERALEFRLQQEPQNKDLAYGLAFANVLQKDASDAIAALKRVVQLDAQNPFAHAYLTFLYLYEWRGNDAQKAIAPALELNPNIPEVQALSGAAALMQGNVFKAWNVLKGLKL